MNIATSHREFGILSRIMTDSLFLALILFAFVSSITPGPNNLMLMASGANFGFRSTIPHMLGISAGLAVMLLAMGAGLAQVFELFPATNLVLKTLSVLYMLWLAWRIAHAAPVRKKDGIGSPLTFLQAAAFQWVNPKAWAMAVTAISAYTPDRTLAALGVVVMVFALVNLPSVGTWAVLGQQMARFLTNPGRLVAFNWTMAGLLVLSLYPVVLAG
jgi:threonine/homoserine/homoserine lactone efflux protein